MAHLFIKKKVLKIYAFKPLWKIQSKSVADKKDKIKTPLQ